MLLKTGKPVDIGRVLEVFQRGDHLDLISKYLISTQLFAKRFREVAGRSLIIRSAEVARSSHLSNSNNGRKLCSNAIGP